MKLEVTIFTKNFSLQVEHRNFIVTATRPETTTSLQEAQHMNPHETNSNQVRGDLERQILARRRDFLKRALFTSAYVAPVAISFASRDLARAASCPGLGDCGKSGEAGK